VKGGGVTLVQVRADSSVPRAQPGSLEPVSMTDRQVPASVRCWLAKAGILDRVAHGVYRLAGAPPPDYPDLRAAWLQLAPQVPAWERTPEQGVVSHRSAAAL
jgi:hypothetical protein